MKALGLDVGSKTIGLAFNSDEQSNIALAWEVWRRQGHQSDAKEMIRRLREKQIEIVVVGMPLELDGRQGARARAVSRFVEVFQQYLDAEEEEVKIEFWDERFSTCAAERTMLEANVSRSKRKQKIDAVAAQFILQGWLDFKQGQGAQR